MLKNLFYKLLGFLDVEASPPRVLEWVKIPWQRKQFMYMSSGQFVRDGQESSSRWYKRTKNGDHLIKSIEYRDALVKQYGVDYFRSHSDEMVSLMIEKA